MVAIMALTLPGPISARSSFSRSTERGLRRWRLRHKATARSSTSNDAWRAGLGPNFLPRGGGSPPGSALLLREPAPQGALVPAPLLPLAVRLVLPLGIGRREWRPRPT